MTEHPVSGEYVREPEENGYHRVVVWCDGDLMWSNACGVEWVLHVEERDASGRPKVLACGSSCPYQGEKVSVAYAGDGAVKHLRFLGEKYHPAGICAREERRVQKADGLHGYLSMSVQVPISEEDGGEENGSARSVVCGTFERRPVKNSYHVGTVSMRGNGELWWANQAGVEWRLVPQTPGDVSVLMCGPTCPYFKGDGGSGDCFIVQLGNGSCSGFSFQGEQYLKVENPTSTKVPSFGYGFSFYSAVWPMIDSEHLCGFQIGLPGTWLIPDNEKFTSPLCPPGTCARDNWPERAPTYKDVFQTIEGGLGYWGSTRFPTRNPFFDPSRHTEFARPMIL